jgi:hypothetical protein
MWALQRATLLTGRRTCSIERSGELPRQPERGTQISAFGRSLPLALSTWCLLSTTQPAEAQHSTRRVWRQRDIEVAGWHRVGDIAAALPTGTASSIDGFTNYFGSMSVTVPESDVTAASWIIRLDGARLSGDLRGLWMLDLLPVAITQLDSVAVTSAPTIVDGKPAFGGAIDLYSRRVNKPLAATMDYQHGDESGDPGPYRYTARTTPNIEKLGPFASGTLAASKGPVAIDAAARYAALNITDPRILSQLGSAGPSVQPDVNASGGSGILTTSAFSGSQEVYGGRGRVTGLLGLPGQPFATARVIGTYGGASGSANAGSWNVRYGTALSNLDVRPLASDLTYDITGERSLIDGYVEAGPDGGNFRFGAGVAHRDNHDSSTTRPANVGRAWTQYHAGSLTTLLTSSFGSGGLHFSGIAGTQLKVRDSTFVAFTVTSLREDADADNGAPVSPPPGPATTLALDEARAELPVAVGRAVVATVFTRVWRSNVAGDAWRGGGGLRVDGTVFNRLHLRADAEGATRPAGTLETTPAFTARGDASLLVSGGFLVAVSGAVSSATRWTLPSGDEELGGIRRIDFSANKRLWSDRVRAQLVLRNLLDSDERYHPLGAQWNFRSHLAITVDLPAGRRVGE